MEIIHCDQLSAEWFQLHVGRVTGSKASVVLDFTKSKEGAKRVTYRFTKAAELLTKIAIQQNYVSWEMEQGTINEPDARADYSIEEGVLVERVGFVISDIDRMACSPDGLINDDGILELKCPKASTHIKWMLDGKIPEEHLPQCRLELACMPDRKWLDFMSFVPELPKRYRGFTIRLMREDAQIPEMIAAVEQFNAEVDAMIARLNDIAPPIDEDEPLATRIDDPELGITDSDIAWAQAGFTREGEQNGN